MTELEWRQGTARVVLLVGSATLAAGLLTMAAGCLGYKIQPNDSWVIVGAKALDPIPRLCSDAVGHGIRLRTWESGTPPIQQDGWDDWRTGGGPGFFDDRYQCALAEITVQQVPGAPKTKAGTSLELFVVHPHAGDPKLDNLQSLIYWATFNADGQKQLVFPRVIVASAWLERRGPGWNDVLTWRSPGEGGTLTVHLGQWPLHGEGSQIVENGKQIKKDCTFYVGFSGAGAIQCP